MHLLQGSKLRNLINDDAGEGIFIDPLLDETQIGEVSVDFRLGYDFHVSVLSRRAGIPMTPGGGAYDDVSNFFQSTRRDIGEVFVLFPGQLALGTTLEYVGLPPNVYADVLSRSSMNRLGVFHNTMIQPGYRGTLPLELMNSNSSPIELVVGSRVMQARFFNIGENHEYFSHEHNRKYYGDVRPRLSAIQ